MRRFTERKLTSDGRKKEFILIENEKIVGFKLSKKAAEKWVKSGEKKQVH